MSNICIKILANYFNHLDKLDDNNSHCWYVLPVGKDAAKPIPPECMKVVTASVGETYCILYENAEDCCNGEVIPSILEWWTEDDVTRAFTPEQIRWIAERTDEEWLRGLAEIN